MTMWSSHPPLGFLIKAPPEVEFLDPYHNFEDSKDKVIISFTDLEEKEYLVDRGLLTHCPGFFRTCFTSGVKVSLAAQR